MKVVQSLINHRIFVFTFFGLALASLSCNSEKHLNLIKEANTTGAYNDFMSKSEFKVPVYPLTKGPDHHWFAYYDKFQTDPTDRFVLAMRTSFQHRSPTPRDTIKVGMIDLKNQGRWMELGASTAWNWQQGCMLQWRPGSEDEIIWNDRVKGKFVSHILNIKTKARRTLPLPFYTISPNGEYALTLDFERIQDVRAGYGYAGVRDKNQALLAPDDAGIYLMSLEDGSSELILSLSEIAAIPYPLEDLSGYKHYFNALSFSPDGQRFVFLHRWVRPGEAARISPLGTRFISANLEGENIHIINDSRMTSHFWWKNSSQILAWANRPKSGNHFYLFEDLQVGEYQIVGKGILTKDGHCSYLPNNEWIINDTYPDKNRQIELYLFNTRTQKKIILGKVYSPPEYTGEWRVDLHPRQSRDSQKIFIDCPVGKDGRQILMLDISRLNLL